MTTEMRLVLENREGHPTEYCIEDELKVLVLV